MRFKDSIPKRETNIEKLNESPLFQLMTLDF